MLPRKTKSRVWLVRSLLIKFGYEALRRKNFPSHKKNDSFEKMKHDLFDQLLRLVHFPLPEGLVEKQKEKLIEQAKKQAERMGLQNGEMAEEMKKSETTAGEKAK